MIKHKVDNVKSRLTKFTTAKELKDVVKGSLAEIQKIFGGYQGRNLPPHAFDNSKKGKLKKSLIYNSTRNRPPAIHIMSVRKEKLGYIFRLGVRRASINLVPLSLFNDPKAQSGLFFLKDRGHILEIVCMNYDNQMFPIHEALQVLKKEEDKVKRIHNYKDSDREEARKIYSEIRKVLNSRVVKYKELKVKKDEQLVSIKDICDKVPAFKNYLMDYPVSIEVSKESIDTHSNELLAINLIMNKWENYQLGELDFYTYLTQKYGTPEKYTEDVLQYTKLIGDIHKLPAFTQVGDSVLFDQAIKKYKKKLNAQEYAHVIPMEFLGLFYSDKDFENMGSMFNIRNRTDVFDILKNLESNNIDYSEASEKLRLLKYIVECKTAWNTFDEKKEDYYREIKKNYGQSKNLTNLEHTNILSESIGLACALAVANLVDNNIGTGGRFSEQEVQSKTIQFLDKLYEKLESICEDDSYFQASGDIQGRFNTLIKPVYEDMLSTSSDMTKEQIAVHHIHDLKDTFFTPKDIRTYNVIKFNKRLTTEELTEDDFRVLDFDGVSSSDDSWRQTSGFDLGEKLLTAGYTLDNTLIQPRWFNRSWNKCNFEVSNVVFWHWYAIHYGSFVDSHKEWLLENNKYEVLGDAKKLKETFSLDKLTDEQVKEYGEFGRTMGEVDECFGLFFYHLIRLNKEK